MSRKQVQGMKIFSHIVIVAAFVAAVAAPLATTSCRQGVKPDQFIGAIVDCTETNGGPMLAAVSQVAECLVVAGGPTSPAAVSCLSDLATAIGATIADASCVVAMLAAPPTTSDGAAAHAPPVQQQASQFLAANRITVKGVR